MDTNVVYDPTYALGDWVAVAGPDTWLLVDLPPADPVVLQCWALISARAMVDEILDVLVTSGIRATPNFVLVRAAGERRAVVRGAGSVWANRTGHDDVELRAAAVSAWVDVALASDTGELVLTSNRPASPGVELPLTSGVTTASLIRIRLAPAPGGESPPTIRLDQPGPEPADAPDEPVTDPSAAARPDAVTADDAVSYDAVSYDAVSYDHLFGATQRPPNTDELDAITRDGILAASPATPEPIGPEPVAPTPAPSGREAGVWATLPPPQESGLIDAVPWASAAPEPAVITRPVPAAQFQPPPPVVRPAQPDRADRASAPEPAPEIVETVDRSRLPAPSTILGPTVLAAYCPAGHLSSAHAAQCRVCRAPMPTQGGFEIARPSLGRLRFSTGDVVTLDRGVVLGRAPDGPATGDAERPNVVRLASPDNDISRNHAEVVLDGWNVYIRDLHSTNGTVITLPDQAPMRLRVDDPHVIEPGTLVSLAEDVTFVFEVP